MNSKTILITGTHHTPAIELIHELESDHQISWNIFYIGHQFHTETHLKNTISKLNVTFYPLSSGKLNRHHLLSNLISPFQIFTAFLKALRLVSKIRPDIIVSFGGYVSVPVIVAGKILGIKSITHEQTLTISLSTKINSFFVNKVALSFPSNFSSSKFVVTGNLVRQEIYNLHSDTYHQLKLDRTLVYITGGSQGSHFLNQLVFKSLPRLNKFIIIHQTGPQDYSEAKKLCPEFSNYFPTEYVLANDIGWIFNHADIVVSRSGANTCQEIDLLDKKAILIPLPYTQQNEQQLNANWLAKNHPSTIKIFNQFHLDSSKFVNALLKLSLHKHRPLIKKLPKVHPLIQIIHEMV